MSMLTIQEEKINGLKALLEAATRVAVLGHTHPDGDALGSTAAMCLFLKEKMGKDVSCILPDTPPENLRFLLASGVPYYFHDTQPSQAVRSVQEAGLVILLDCNAFRRTEALEQPLLASAAPKVLIDHHLNPDTERFNLVFSTPDISSASELLYWILKAMAPENTPSSASLRDPIRANAPEGVFSGAIGAALLAGMTTDTNNFANSVYPSTFQMASELISAGVDRDAILQQIYWNYRENRVRLMGYMQSQQLHVLPNGAAYMIMSREIQQRFDLREGESEGLVNVPLAIGDVRLSVLVKEDQGHYRVSVRSKKGTSAQQLAQRYFHGGGHENAAGGKIFPAEDLAEGQDIGSYVQNILTGYLR